jgi:hypothetical protein
LSIARSIPMWFRKQRFGRSAGFREVTRIVKRERIRDLTIVETGTLRCDQPAHMQGDGWSTLYFRGLIDRFGGTFFSVDIDPDHIATSRAVVTREFGNLENTVHHCGDSVAFLQSFDRAIDILYLDSFDYSGDSRAAEHQLAEIEAALNKLSLRCIVLLDDICETIENGKAALTIPYLRSQGWRMQLIPVIERTQKQWYQAILRPSGA